MIQKIVKRIKDEVSAKTSVPIDYKEKKVNSTGDLLLQVGAKGKHLAGFVIPDDAADSYVSDIINHIIQKCKNL